MLALRLFLVHWELDEQVDSVGASGVAAEYRAAWKEPEKGGCRWAERAAPPWAHGSKTNDFRARAAGG